VRPQQRKTHVQATINCDAAIAALAATILVNQSDGDDNGAPAGLRAASKTSPSTGQGALCNPAGCITIGPPMVRTWDGATAAGCGRHGYSWDTLHRHHMFKCARSAASIRRLPRGAAIWRMRFTRIVAARAAIAAVAIDRSLYMRFPLLRTHDGPSHLASDHVVSNRKVTFSGCDVHPSFICDLTLSKKGGPQGRPVR